MNVLKKVLLWAGLLAVSLPVLGWLYQAIAARRDAVKYPPLGKLVDVGGYRLHLYEMGSGRRDGPTVIFESGLGCSCLDWCKVQPEVAKFAHAVSYDRAGLGWSDSSPNPRTSEQMVAELHTLLTNANVPRPYILVGHSFGGLTIRLYADTYPQEVVGMVFVDTSHEDQHSLPALAKEAKKGDRLATILTAAAPFGFIRLIVDSGQSPLKNMHYPAAIVPQIKALASQTRDTSMSNQEMRNFATSATQVRASRHSYGALPLVVLTQQQKTEFSSFDEQQIQDAWLGFQRDLASLSSNSTHIIAEHSTHYIQLDQPELVSNAIRSVLQAVPEQPQHQGKG